MLLGFHNGQVVASGTKSHVIRQMNALSIQYTITQLSCGQTLIPGMIEPHLHIVLPALMMGWTDLSLFQGQSLQENYTLQWLIDQIRSATVMQRCSSSDDQWFHAHWIHQHYCYK